MTANHPVHEISGSRSQRLQGKKIVLGICGSVSLIKAPETARLLIREGATVIPVMTAAACSLIQPALLEWATGNPPITQLTGAVEHVIHCGDSPSRADALLIYPCTANTLSKMACAIDDTPVTTFASTAIGEGIPTVAVPAMHLPMFRHPAMAEQIHRLRKWGITVMEPEIAEGKAKILSPEAVVQHLISLLTDKQEAVPAAETAQANLAETAGTSAAEAPIAPTAGNAPRTRILISCGRTVEPIDPFRVITNRSSGKMGAALVQAALNRSWEVTVITGAAEVTYPNGIRCIYAETTQAMQAALQRELTSHRYDIFISAAAVSDWTPLSPAPQKISTRQKSLTLTLIPTPKLIDTVKDLSPTTFLTAFRALSGLNREAMLAEGKKRLQTARADLICINAIDSPNTGFEADTNAFSVLSKNGTVYDLPLQSKTACAEAILSIIQQERQ